MALSTFMPELAAFRIYGTWHSGRKTDLSELRIDHQLQNRSGKEKDRPTRTQRSPPIISQNPTRLV